MIIAFGQTIDAIVTEAPEQVIKGRNRQAVNVTTSDLSYLQAKDLFSSDISREAFFLANSDGNDYSDYVVFGGVTDNENGTVTVLMGKRLDGDVLPSDLLLNSAYEKMVMGLNIGEGQTILAGSPVNKDGIVANDDTAIGILLEDVAFPKKNGEVLISGFIDAIKAQTASGLTYSADMMASLKNIMFDGVKDYGSGGGGDILETVTVSEPNIVYETILVESGWSRLGKAWEYTPAPDITPADGDYTVVFNGESFQGTVEAETFRSSNGDRTIQITFGDGGYISTSNLLDSAMDVPLQIINGTIEKTETKIKQEYLPAMPMFVHFKPTDDSYEVNHTYDEIVNVIEACGSVVATMSKYGSVVESSYKIEIWDDSNEIRFKFQSREIILKSNNVIESNSGEQ